MLLFTKFWLKAYYNLVLKMGNCFCFKSFDANANSDCPVDNYPNQAIMLDNLKIIQKQLLDEPPSFQDVMNPFLDF